MMAETALAVLLATIPVPPAAAGAAAVAPSDPSLARAHHAAAALTTELLGRLRKELDAGGPAKAIAVCSEVAPAIAARLSGDGLTVRRVGTRVRNPAQRPRPVRGRRAGPLAGGDRTRCRASGGGRLGRGGRRQDAAGDAADHDRQALPGVPRPASSLDPAVRAALAERYPADRATGYREGDLRGAVSVTVVP